MINKTTIRIPKMYHSKIKVLYRDKGGYWCIVADGYYAAGKGDYDECHLIHELTQTSMLVQIRRIKKLK